MPQSVSQESADPRSYPESGQRLSPQIRRSPAHIYGAAGTSARTFFDNLQQSSSWVAQIDGGSGQARVRIIEFEFVFTQARKSRESAQFAQWCLTEGDGKQDHRMMSPVSPPNSGTGQARVRISEFWVRFYASPRTAKRAQFAQWLRFSTRLPEPLEHLVLHKPEHRRRALQPVQGNPQHPSGSKLSPRRLAHQLR